MSFVGHFSRFHYLNVLGEFLVYEAEARKCLASIRLAHVVI